MGPTEIETFLSHLAIEGNVSASTQNQAISAILFLYRQVLDIFLEDARRHQFVDSPVDWTHRYFEGCK